MASLLKQANAIGKHEKKYMGKPLPKGGYHAGLIGTKAIEQNTSIARIKGADNPYRRPKGRHTGAKMIGEV